MALICLYRPPDETNAICMVGKNGNHLMRVQVSHSFLGFFFFVKSNLDCASQFHFIIDKFATKHFLHILYLSQII